ncbi:TolC family protein [Flavobacterium ammonificans]|jgi:outer membrane protein TolC|uniref:TolC family protein n=1 Tax=Flavobacterium ammonificans TaxID=1751056 RepID=UPI001E4DA5AB|nr:TolC family protein [Flavobacterium ammonificans]BDB56483.1 transporter [Flavobacterium ammonificans]
MKKIQLIVLLTISFVFHAQTNLTKESYSFSLNEAIEHALKNNYAAINAARDIDAAKKKKWETTTIGLPQINASLGYQNNIELQKSLIPAEFFGGQPGEFAEVAFGTRHNMIGNATVSQLIFNGSYIVGLQSAKVYLQISENAKIKTNQEIREMVVNAYGNVLLANESIAILEKNKTNLEKTLNETTQIFKNGLIEEENVEQLQITLTTIKSAQENIKRQKVIATNMLKLILGITIEKELILTENLNNLALNNINFELSTTPFQVENSIDFKIQENLVQSKKLLLLLEKSNALPSLAAAYNFGYNAFGNQFQFFTNNQRWLNFSNVGLSLNVPIFSSLGRSARTQQAKIALEQAKTQMTQVEQSLKLQFEKAKSDYEYSLEQLNTTKSSLTLAERIENKQQIKLKEGLSSSFDLSEAQRQLYATQQNYLQAMLDVINKKASLEKIITKN